MGHRLLASISALASVLALMSLAAPPLRGQTPEPAKNTWTPPRTAWGAPDLRGVWDYRTITPFERPGELAGKKILSDDEAAEFEAREVKRRDKDRLPTRGVGSYNQFWWDYGDKLTDDKRTSLIVDPPDGRIPPLTPEAQKRADALKAVRARRPQGPEDLNIPSRCILGFNAGPPMNPSAYNNNFQLFQTPEYVVILNEMVHDARIVPLDGRAHLPEHIRQWRADSRGHWEGDTLIVDTTNFSDKTSFRGSGKNMHLVERFTRVDADTLLYEYTIHDPKSFTKSWGAAIPMKTAGAPLFEYACHEGNYSMFTILEGARAQERAAEEAEKQCSEPVHP